MTTTDEDIIKKAQDALERDEEHWSEIYQRAKEDLFFLSDDPYAQWDQADYTARKASNRPALTIDQLSQFINQVANDIRMNTPSINIIPSRDGDIETAEVYKGLIRNIEYASNADEAYDTASNFAIKCSIGFIRVDHDYESDEGFEQVLKVCRVINPMAIYFDSDSIESDGRDAKRALVLEKMTIKEFKSRWPDKEISCFQNNNQDFSKAKDDDEITVAEFFCIESEEKAFKIDESGTISEYNDGDEQYEGFKAKRKVKKTRVMRYKLSGKDVLEKGRFPGKYIPIVPVYGEEAWEGGERKLLSLIRKSKGAQQMYNVWKSLETELLMKQPNAPVMVGEGQIEDYAEDWKDPSKSMALRYKTSDANGNPLPAPIRLAAPGIPAGVVNAARESVDDIKATMGLYNASIGARSNETSGKAINARKQEGDVATFHFGDNLVRSITQVGRILVHAIPEIYDTERVVRIIGEEDEPRQITLNGGLSEGQERPFDLSKGQYDVKVITGASFTTKRQEAAEFFTEVVTRQPELMTVMGDLLFKNMDFSGSQAMAARMKKLIDPKLLSPEEQEEQQQQVDPEKQQMAQIIQELQAQLQQAGQELQSKQADLAVKQQDSQMKMQESRTKTELEVMKMQMDAEQAQLEAEIKMRELAIKERELQLKEQEIMLQAMQPEPAAHEMAEGEQGEEKEVVNDDEDGLLFKLDRVRKKKAVEQQDKEVMAQKEAQNEEIKAIRLNQEQEKIQGLQGIQQLLGSLAQEISKPKQVIYDEQGRLVGVK